MPSQECPGDSALLVLDADGNAIQFNPQARFLGLVPKDAVLPVPAAQLPRFLEEALGAVRAGGSGSFSVRALWARAGQLPGHFQVDSLWIPGPVGHGEAGRCLLAVRLLEAGEAVADAPLDASNPRPWYAARAHEIKNSLVAVKTLVDLVLEKQPGLGIAHIVRQEIQRINALVGQMLTTSAPDQPRFEWVKPHHIIESVARLMTPQLHDRSVLLQVELGAGEEEVWGDPHQIEQAILNLVINGFEAMGPDGKLTVRTSIQRKELPLARGSQTDPQRAYVIAVSDSGSGIAPDHLDRLFDEFFTTKPGGTGLGLPITRQIVRAHRGLIEVQTDPSKGTTFELFFPMHQRTASAEP
jgi:signal transduction histidine kinase